MLPLSAAASGVLGPLTPDAASSLNDTVFLFGEVLLDFVEGLLAVADLPLKNPMRARTVLLAGTAVSASYKTSVKYSPALASTISKSV